MKKSFLAPGISALALIGLSGCGGSSVSPGTPGGPSTPVTRGNAAFNIKWPPRSSDTTRLIPQAANSLLILVTDSNGTQVERRVITRPTGDILETHIEFNNLDPIRHTFNVSAHPGTSADGTAQARGAVSLDVPTGGTVTQSLRLDSTIDHITLSQTTADIKPGRELLVVATPYDSDGNIVLVAGSWQWLSTNPSALSITYDKGLATFRPGVSGGTTTVTAKDSESGKSAAKPCSVGLRSEWSVLGADHVFPPVDETATRMWYAYGLAWVFSSQCAKSRSPLSTIEGKSAQLTNRFLASTIVLGSLHWPSARRAKRSATASLGLVSSHESSRSPPAVFVRNGLPLPGGAVNSMLSGFWRLSRNEVEIPTAAASKRMTQGMG